MARADCAGCRVSVSQTAVLPTPRTRVATPFDAMGSMSGGSDRATENSFYSGLPFTFVRIPADDAQDVEELEAQSLGYAGDALPNLLASARFASSGADASWNSDAQTSRVLAAASEGRSETFALVHPSSTNGLRGVYLYVDEVGKLKRAPANVRAADLARRCGLAVDGGFHGDAFVGAVSAHPRTTNVSFKANELESDAAWLIAAPSENAEYAAAARQFRDAVATKKPSGRFAIPSNPDEDSDEDADEDSDSDEDEDEDASRRRRPSWCALLSSEETKREGFDMTVTEGLESYFKSIVSERNAPVAVRASNRRGNGVFATRDLKKGETIWVESPVVSTQTSENATVVLACAWCHRSVGTVDAQLDLAAGRLDAFEAARRAGACGEPEPEPRGSGKTEPRGSGKTEPEPVSRFANLPGFEAAVGLSKITPCRHRASRKCAALYCSSACLVEHARHGHDVACCPTPRTKGASASEEAFLGKEAVSFPETEASEFRETRRIAVAAATAFRRDCGHHENLQLATAMVGVIAARVRAGEDWMTATEAFRGFAGGPWWEVSGENDEETARKLRGVAARSAKLLRASALAAAEAAAFEAKETRDRDSSSVSAAEASAATTSAIPFVLDRLGVAGFGHLLGICDLNQWSLKVDGPMRNVTREILRLDENRGAEATKETLEALLPLALDAQARRDEEDAEAGRPRWGGGGGGDVDDDVDDDDEKEIRLDAASDAEDLYDTSRRVFPMFSGQALFPLTCLLNHSCEPSAMTRFRSWRGGTAVRVEALRDVKESEELSVSYVDENASLEDRNEALAGYGFACRCPACVDQGVATAEAAKDVD